MTEPPFTVNHARPRRSQLRATLRQAPQLTEAIIDTARTGKAVLVPPLDGETLDQARARVATLYNTVKRQGFAMRTSISKDPPGIYAWAERKEDEPKNAR